MKMDLPNGFSIGLIGASDKPAFMEYLVAPEIYAFTLRIPHPYTPADADWWINHVAKESEKLGRPYHFSIRNPEGKLVGAIGFHDQEAGCEHRAEMGYWLAKPYWNRGIMTDAVRRLTQYGFEEVGLKRITANVFIHNDGSSRVLEKAEFEIEGILRNYYKKDGKIFDGKLYAKIK